MLALSANHIRGYPQTRGYPWGHGPEAIIEHFIPNCGGQPHPPSGAFTRWSGHPAGTSSHRGDRHLRFVDSDAVGRQPVIVLGDTFAGIRPIDAPGFILAQLVALALALPLLRQSTGPQD